MDKIATVDDLETLYGSPGPESLRKVADRLTPAYRRWIFKSRFCVLATVGPEGSDASPRGDDADLVVEHDPRTLLMPDWRGNNRLDSLRNIVRDGRVALMFMVPGSSNVVRVNGRAAVTADESVLAGFERKGMLPRSVVIVEIEEIYFQCARAILRSDLWGGVDMSDGLPSAGDMLAEMSKGEVGGADYDAAWPERAKKTLW